MIVLWTVVAMVRNWSLPHLSILLIDVSRVCDWVSLVKKKLPSFVRSAVFSLRIQWHSGFPVDFPFLVKIYENIVTALLRARIMVEKLSDPMRRSTEFSLIARVWIPRISFHSQACARNLHESEIFLSIPWSLGILTHFVSCWQWKHDLFPDPAAFFPCILADAIQYVLGWYCSAYGPCAALGDILVRGLTMVYKVLAGSYLGEKSLCSIQ